MKRVLLITFCTKFNHPRKPKIHVTSMNIKFSILIRSWKYKKYREHDKIQNIKVCNKMLFIPHFLALFIKHIHLGGPNHSLRYDLYFSSRCEGLIRAYHWSKKIWKRVEIYYCMLGEESERSEASANKWGLFQKHLMGFGVVVAVQPQENVAIFTLI